MLEFLSVKTLFNGTVQRSFGLGRRGEMNSTGDTPAIGAGGQEVRKQLSFE
jgi:hypothetical protein